MKNQTLFVAAFAALFATASAHAAVERIFRPAVNTRGNVNIKRLQPVENASWVWHPEEKSVGAGAMEITHGGQSGAKPSTVMVFEKDFEVKEGDGALVFDVSADERFYLTLDGAFVARGPNRGTVENWQYQTYKADLKPGRHVLKAVVTKLDNHAPLAQLSYRGGFLLKAEGVYDARLTTGKAKWKVGRYYGMQPNGADNGVWGTGSQFLVTGTGPYAVEGVETAEAVVVRGPAGRDADSIWGGRTPGWMLFPSQLPDQTELHSRPGAFLAATHAAPWRAKHVYTADETKAPEVAALNALLKDGKALTIPANTKLQAAWHLGRYATAYPILKTAGGKGARVSWTWTESSREGQTKRKGDRAEILGKYLEGYGETFVSDGRPDAEFSAPWFRSGLWCRIDIETKDEPLVLKDIELIESHYPFEMESEFVSPQDKSLQDIRRISARAMQMCAHEMLFDCPYYEQQMYPGDTRVQLLILGSLMRDDRIIKRAIEFFALNTRDDGQAPFNYPTRGTQEGFTYTQCYLLMYGDYAMNHADREWLRMRLPAMRHSMSGCELYENAEGLIENAPGWMFMDWPANWRGQGDSIGDGTAPGSRYGEGVNAEVNLFWLLDMQSAAATERAFGNELQAKYWEAKAEKLKKAIVAKFWCAERGLLADTPQMKNFSEHAQALAILADALPKDKVEICFKHLVEDRDLIRTTVYFNYYLFEAYFKMGRADLFQQRLDLWRNYVALNVTTLLESPDDGKKGPMESRSDCHGWGGHPIWFMQTGLAGIRSAAPFFAKVRVAPQPGTLKELKAKHPHPQGYVEVDLKFDGGKATGVVKTPVEGVFEYGGATVPLKAGVNAIGGGNRK